MAGAIWAVAELDGDKLKSVSKEVVTCGQALAEALGADLEIVVPGASTQSAAQEISGFDAGAVRTIEDPTLDPYTPDVFAAALSQAIREQSPQIVVFPHTYQVRDWVPRLAAELGVGFISDVVGHRVDEGRPTFVRQPYQGKLNADCVFSGQEPHLVSVQAGAYLADDANAGSTEVVPQSVDLVGTETRTDVLETFQEVEDRVDLSRSEVIVAVGRGIGKEENIALVEELAAALGGQVAASRPVCDNEWLPMDRQIGSSGQTVSPRLYVAVGISGAIQHIVGMKNSGTVVAINKDPNAPIFAVSDYGIVGDLFEVVPALTERVGAVRSA